MNLFKQHTLVCKSYKTGYYTDNKFIWCYKHDVMVTTQLMWFILTETFNLNLIKTQCYKNKKSFCIFVN